MRGPIRCSGCRTIPPACLCCLLAFLFLWRTRESINRGARHWAVVLAAVAFASAFGLSVYVAFGFALLMLAWLLRLAVLRHHRAARSVPACCRREHRSAHFCFRHSYGSSSAGHAHSSIATGSQSAAPATHLFSISVRRFIDSGSAHRPARICCLEPCPSRAPGPVHTSAATAARTGDGAGLVWRCAGSAAPAKTPPRRCGTMTPATPHCSLS